MGVTDGIMLVATLNRTLKSYALAIIGAEYILNWLPHHTHDWDRFLTPKELAALVQRHGLKPGEPVGVQPPARRLARVERCGGELYAECDEVVVSVFTRLFQPLKCP